MELEKVSVVACWDVYKRQAIARAILKNAPILILDEATSASDPENQMEIEDVYKRQAVT